MKLRKMVVVVVSDANDISAESLDGGQQELGVCE